MFVQYSTILVLSLASYVHVKLDLHVPVELVTGQLERLGPNVHAIAGRLKMPLAATARVVRNFRRPIAASIAAAVPP